MDQSQTNCQTCSAIQRWIKQPFSASGSLVNWIMFVGLIMITIFFWSRILARIAP